MRAVRFIGIGKPLEVVELADPTPGPDEVVVKVAPQSSDKATYW